MKPPGRPRAPPWSRWKRLYCECEAARHSLDTGNNRPSFYLAEKSSVRFTGGPRIWAFCQIKMWASFFHLSEFWKIRQTCSDHTIQINL